MLPSGFRFLNHTIPNHTIGPILHPQIRLWCASGIISGMAVVLLSLRGVVSEFLFIYVGQLLMLVGNAGRVIALRMFTEKSLSQPFLFYTVTTLLY